MGLGFDFIEKGISAVSGLVDNFHHSGEEKAEHELKKAEAKRALVELQQGFTLRLAEYETKMTQLQAEVMIADAKGDSWIQRSYRPIILLIFAGLVVAYFMGYTSERVTEATANELLRLVSGAVIVTFGTRGLAQGVRSWKSPESRDGVS